LYEGLESRLIYFFVIYNFANLIILSVVFFKDISVSLVLDGKLLNMGYKSNNKARSIGFELDLFCIGNSDLG
jgi:hypothetical protein